MYTWLVYEHSLSCRSINISNGIYKAAAGILLLFIYALMVELKIHNMRANENMIHKRNLP